MKRIWGREKALIEVSKTLSYWLGVCIQQFKTSGQMEDGYAQRGIQALEEAGEILRKCDQKAFDAAERRNSRRLLDKRAERLIKKGQAIEALEELKKKVLAA